MLSLIQAYCIININDSIYFISLGAVWLKHGEILDLSVTCDGSGPWKYCHYITTQNSSASHNISNISCESSEMWLSEDTISGKCIFNVRHWFRDNGAYSVIIVVTDGLTRIAKQVGINVYTGPRYVFKITKTSLT